MKSFIIRVMLIAASLSVCMSAFSARHSKDEVIDLSDLEFDLDTTMLSSDTTNIDGITEEIEEEYQDITYEPRMSTISIPVSINIPTLEKKINDNISGLIYQDTVLSDDGLEIKAWKARDFKINFEGNTLTCKLPIKIWANVEIDLGITTTVREINAEIEVDLKSDVTIMSDWRAHTVTEIVDYKWTKKPTIKILGTEIKIGFVADQLIQRNKQLIHDLINQTVNQNLQMRDYANEIWTSLQQPIAFNTEGYDAFIVANPYSIHCTPLLGSLGKISSTITMQARTEVYMANEPKLRHRTIRPLPMLKISDQTSDGVDMQILADIPYTFIEQMTDSMLNGTTYEAGRFSITVDSTRFYGNNDKLVIALSVNGSLNGTVYLESIPYFDSAETAIKLKDVDIKLKSKNILMKTLSVLFRRTIVRKLEQEFSLSLKEEFYQLKDLSRSAMFDNALYPGIKMNGRLDTIDVSQVYITRLGLKIAVEIGGVMHLSMD